LLVFNHQRNKKTILNFYENYINNLNDTFSSSARKCKKT